MRDWTQENEAYFRAIRIEKTMMGLILMLIVAVAVFNIVATLVMVVNDKRTDIAILRTLGLSPRGVIAVFMTQGVLIGWIGHAAGRGARACARLQRGCHRAVPRTIARISYHGPRCVLHFGHPERSARAATWSGSPWSRLLLTLRRDGVSGAASGAHPTCRSAAVRMMRYWYEGFIGLRYLRASPQRGSCR